MKTQIPVIFWHSDPVGPNETVVISGGNFESSAVVEFQPLPDSGTRPSRGWTAVTPLQQTDISLKAVIPARWKPGHVACRIRQGRQVSATVFLNAPDVWWKQGDEGVDRARQGGWLRILGKCLAGPGGAEVALHTESRSRKIISLKLENATGYNLEARIPADLPPGRYPVSVHNRWGGEAGWRSAGALEVLPVAAEPDRLVNVLDFGADPNGLKDCTLAIVQATERLASLGGGVVYFPQGRYRIDSILRSGTWIASPILIPENVIFRGEGPDLVSLWWPDQEKPLPSLLEGRDRFAIEDLSLFTQGRHSTLITGANQVRIRNVRIRANCYYMTNNNGGAHHQRKVDPPGASGAAILLWGDNNQVTDCDIYTSALAFDLRSARGSRIANNTICANNMHFMNGAREMIFENNTFRGNSLTTGGSNIALHMGASISRHVFYAHNRSESIYGGDHEAFTLDGHATAYQGKVRNVTADAFTLSGKRFPRSPKAKGSMSDMHSTAVYILDGKGAGQYRFVQSYKGNRIRIDRPWELEPDATSQICIGGFNGRHLFIGNTAVDTGTLIQLYPPNCECIVAENRAIRASNINSLGKFGKQKQQDFVRVEPSWYNQFLDNHIITGNTWGGGCTQIDRWIGGESTLNIWGWEVFYDSVNGVDFDEFLNPDVLKMILHEKKARAVSLPISRFQIIRRHRIDNNSSIRIHGAVADVLVEGCEIRRSRKGIRIDMEMDYKQPRDIGQLFDFDPEEGPDNISLPFLRPSAVVLRNNQFHDVSIPYSGTALKSVLQT